MLQLKQQPRYKIFHHYINMQYTTQTLDLAQSKLRKPGIDDGTKSINKLIKQVQRASKVIIDGGRGDVDAMIKSITDQAIGKLPAGENTKKSSRKINSIKKNPDAIDRNNVKSVEKQIVKAQNFYTRFKNGVSTFRNRALAVLLIVFIFWFFTQYFPVYLSLNPYIANMAAYGQNKIEYIQKLVEKLPQGFKDKINKATAYIDPSKISKIDPLKQVNIGPAMVKDFITQQSSKVIPSLRKYMPTIPLPKLQDIWDTAMRIGLQQIIGVLIIKGVDTISGIKPVIENSNKFVMDKEPEKHINEKGYSILQLATTAVEQGLNGDGKLQGNALKQKTNKGSFERQPSQQRGRRSKNSLPSKNI